MTEQAFITSSKPKNNLSRIQSMKRVTIFESIF